MMRFFKRIQINALVTALLYALLGLLFVLLPGITMRTICYILAAALALLGIAYIADYFRAWDIAYRQNGLAIGLLFVLSALFLLLRADAVIAALPVLVGFAVLVSGLIKVQNAIVLHRAKDRGFVYALIGAAVSLALGAVLIENPFAAARALAVMIGASLLYSGLSDLFILFVMRRIRDAQRP